METIKRYSIPMIGLVMILSALLIASFASAKAVGIQRGWGQQQGMGMMPGGMMGGSMARMMVDVDRHFIEGMIPHHEDAIAMAATALEKAQRPEIKKLANDINRVQQAEIAQMRLWYKQWFGTDVPSNDDNYQNMMGSGNSEVMGAHMGMSMDLDYLANAADFDKAFIKMMIPHHQMALMMSNMVLMNGQSSELQALARSIITGQSTEIEQMQTWYRQWYGTDTPTP